MPDFRRISLTTDRLSLRPLHTGDADALLAIFSDPEVMRYWNTSPWSSRQDAIDFIDHSHQALASKEQVILGVYDRHSQQLLGKCLLFAYDVESRRAEIGFGLSRQSWGKGYIQETGQALIRFGFEDLNLNRLEAEIDPANTASGKALERLGFNREGLLRERWIIDSQVSDSGLYGLLRSDWQAPNTIPQER